ncbi:MAG TPA: hypothetical protein VLI93_04735 [Acetobacteraceae bacterium]|nr:hypothetical protein [Acetobacteraceae bacterium]
MTAANTLATFGDKCDEAAAEAEAFEYYSDGSVPRLLAGTIMAVFKTLGKGSTNADALAALENAYQDQCLVSRGDWLVHLGIAGANVKIGSDSDHYTTFNNSVPVGTDVSVAGYSADNAGATLVCGSLFEAAVPFLRIHATFVQATIRYHRYWSRAGAIYSNNVLHPNPFPALDARYQQMATHMIAAAIDVIKVHGRIGTNKMGPKI